ncbi:UDP-N-acetylglucosamine 2-epimerase [Bradyrhizobium symbiodeficiens]|uniref:UDP-N-acetylglucosamine 2-epimerase n=1 Tax=Bradyrhizobium symbiodeficiens TaxID=1404367 RepID=UPI001AEEE032|nr:UDP-N-acetylglucosamine 2-epimerase [Bradyrhizobium symbiodeficiens]
MSARRIAFLTGTRADFGKLKPLMQKIQNDPAFDTHVFVTGMHLLSKYGYTCDEVVKAGFTNIHKYINQNSSDRMDHILAKTISGLSDYVTEIRPELLVIHGDRVEALAGAAVGALNNIRVGHVEGGEVSGTIDESIRHAVSKFAHVHFVANEAARQRLNQLGESDSSIYVIGSPDIDVVNSPSLPAMDAVRQRYDLTFERYGLLLFHPVTTEVDDLRRHVTVLVDELIASGRKYVVIYPNNDHGTDIILEEYRRLAGKPDFRVYPSIRFEYFLTLMRNADFIIGNSSAGVREAPHLGLPAVNLGSRQTNRVQHESIINSEIEPGLVRGAIDAAVKLERKAVSLFGHGNSAEMFHEVLLQPEFWRQPTQKSFVDLSK